MKVHHLNCGTMRPIGTVLLPEIFSGAIPCHCLLIEHNDRLVLVDSGVSSLDLADTRRLGGSRWFLKFQVNASKPALQWLRDLGYQPTDLTDIVLTHLDLDHAGGVADFPHATVHVHAPEYDAARHPAGYAIATSNGGSISTGRSILPVPPSGKALRGRHR